jgi:hypothetical protein
LKMEKPNSAQVGPLSPAPRTRAPSVPTRAPSLPLSVLLPRGLGLSASFLSHARPLPSLSRRSHLSAHPQPPAHDPPPGRAHDLAISGHLRTSSPLLSLAPCSPTFPRSLAPSVEPSCPLSRSAHATRELRHRPPSTDVRSATVIEPAPRLLPR